MSDRIAPSALVSLWLVLGMLCSGCGPDRIRGGGSGVASVGAASAALVGSTTHSSLRVELDFVTGLAPSPYAIGFLQRRLSERCNKPGGVRVVRGRALPLTGLAEHEDEGLRKRIAGLAPLRAATSTLVVRILYVDGRSAQDRAAGRAHLGLSLGPRAIAVFPEQIRLNASGVSAEELEGALVLHEVGHLMGLVGRGAPLTGNHADLSRPSHCSTRPCVMAHSSADWGLGALGEPDFCSTCVGDLQAAGGR